MLTKASQRRHLWQLSSPRCKLKGIGRANNGAKPSLRGLQSESGPSGGDKVREDVPHRSESDNLAKRVFGPGKMTPPNCFQETQLSLVVYDREGCVGHLP